MDPIEAQIINRILAEHGTNRGGATHPLGTVMSAPYSYQTSRNSMYVIDLASGVRPDRVMRLDSTLDDRMTRYRGESKPTLVRFLMNPFTVVVPRRQPEQVAFRSLVSSLRRQPAGVAQITLGEFYPHAASAGQRSKRWLRLDLCNPTTPHLLFAGTTGSGKSTNTKASLLSLAITADPRHLGMILVDGKGMDYPQLRDLPHLIQPVIYDPTDTLLAFRRVIAEMNRRRAICGDDPTRIATIAHEFPQIVIWVDEVGVLFDDAASPIAMAAQDILQRGRGMGIHFIGGTQKPSAALIGSTNMANLPVRACGVVASKNEGYYATGIAGTELGAHRLAGNGDFLLVQNGATVLPYQAPFIDSDQGEDVRIVNHVRTWWEGQRCTLQLPEPIETGTITVRTSTSAVKAERAEKHQAVVDAVKAGNVQSVHGVVQIHKSRFGTELNFNTAQKLYDRATKELQGAKLVKGVKPC